MRHCFLVGCAAAVAALAGLGGTIPVHAGGAQGSARMLLKRAFMTTAARSSVHTSGGLSVEFSRSTGGITTDITVKANFRGDLSKRGGQPKLHIKGYALGHRFKAVVAGDSAAVSYGAKPWQCQSGLTAGVAGMTFPTMASPMKFLRRIQRHVRVMNLGAENLLGVPVWHIRAMVLLHLPTSMAAGIGSNGVVSQKAAYSWVHVTVNFWVDQADYTLRKVSGSARTAVQHGYVRVALWDRLSRYGENVPIMLPAACRG